jgi:tetratricopeptide (TPR) repeat protein
MNAGPIAVISSTTRGLPAHRKAAEDACLRQEFFPKMMEHLGPRTEDAVALSLELVDQADVYILILGTRYGEVPAGHDMSYTHLELERAVARGIPRVLLLMDLDKHPVVPSDVETGPGAARLQELREELRLEQGVGFFASVDDMRALLIQGLSRLRHNLRPSNSSMHYVRQLTSPPQPYVAHPYTLLQTAEVIGRHRELNRLTDWVADRGSELFHSPVLALIAIGGMGKSAVTWKWFNDIAPQEMPALKGRVWWSFYESDATFDNFVIRALAYVTGRPVEELKRVRRAEREDELLEILHREPYLVVLDGLERLLIAYARADASRFADDDLDIKTANFVAGALGLPASAAQSYTGQSRLRLTADPRAGAFLRRLAELGASRILVSSRLFPAELQTVTGEPVRGASAIFLTGLDSAEAVQLWRAFRVTGRRNELVKLFATFDNYPLLVRALAGEVARFRRAPGDFDAWRAAHPEFDPFRLPLTQRKAHVLLYALRGLTEPEQRLLNLVAAFRMPAHFATLAAMLVGESRPFTDEADLDAALFALEDRGVLGWDKRANRYDLHPVVRGVTWSTVAPAAQQDIYRDLADHFEALPEADSQVTSMDDLAVKLELYHTLIRLGRGKDAMAILDDDIASDGVRLGAYRELGELYEMLVNEPGARSDLDDDDRLDVVALTGVMFHLSGLPWRFLDAYDTIRALPEQGDILALRAIAQRQVGELSQAHATALESLAAHAAESPGDPWKPSISALALGLVESARGAGSADRRLRDLRITSGDNFDDMLSMLAVGELCSRSLRDGDIAQARRWADIATRMATRAELHAASVQSATLRGAIALRLDQVDQADEELYSALARAREVKLGDEEADLLILLADRHLRTNDLDSARQRLYEAEPLIDRGRLRLRRADALVMLSRIEHAAGDEVAAARAARDAWEAAWCDGPPFAYADGLRRARECLARTGTPEPSGDVQAPATPVPEPLLQPLTVADVVPLIRDAPSVRVGALRALAWSGDESGTAALRDLVRDGSTSTRTRAIEVASDPDYVEPAVWRGMWPDLERSEDHVVRIAFVGELARRPVDEALETLVRLAERDPAAEIRSAALSALAAEADRVERMPQLLLDAAEHDPDADARDLSLRLLAGWDGHGQGEPLLAPGELERFLERRAVVDQDPEVQGRALALLLSSVSDEKSWQRAFDRAIDWNQAADDRPLSWILNELGATPWGRAPEVLDRLVEPRNTQLRPGLGRYFSEVFAHGGEEHLRQYLDHANAGVRQAVFTALAKILPGRDRLLLSEDLDGEEPYLTPDAVITAEVVRVAASKLEATEEQVWAAYARLSQTFPIRLAR